MCATKDHFADYLGVRVERMGPGCAKASITIDKRHLNLHGTAHGAFLFGVVGTALAAAANDDEYSGVVSAVHIDYVSPAHVGDELIATASTAERLAREDLFLIRLVRQSDARLVAQASGRATRRTRSHPSS